MKEYQCHRCQKKFLIKTKYTDHLNRKKKCEFVENTEQNYLMII